MLFDRSDILHHCQQQARRPVPQKINFLASQAVGPVYKKLIENIATYEIDRPYTGKSGTPRNWRRELIQTGQSQPNIATAASLSSSEKSSIAVCSSAGRCQLIFGRRKRCRRGDVWLRL